MIRKSPLMMSVVIACLWMPLAARALDGESVVSGTASVSIDKPADSMRLQVMISLEGATPKEALDKLKARRESIKSGLGKLGASEPTFTADNIAISDGSSPGDRRAALERAMRDRMPGGRGAASQPAPKVTAMCMIKVDWPLKRDTPEAMILAAEEIKSKVKSSKLLEAPKAAALSEEEEEAALMAMAQMEQSPTEPVYVFVAAINDAENAKAIADAFAKAKASAASLAKAAGAELGTLKSLQSQVSSDPEQAYAMQEYMGSSYYRQMAMSRAYGTDSKEALSSQPGKVTMQVMVQASFAIK